ncbi:MULTISPECIES: helix-turn-helix transcriptional regulator [Glutamicibacter]|uniref:Transcriptional regulator n=1 Tax=Glutamicibacter arilaitensis (strain DSM 16368 / CIP 108037 / IAM 15318 / JCM 13566 / NCIMB 14258 / Re117) TaxID=861360 RepID=A0ABP1U2K2_GLUAR|nr:MULTISPECIES: WYL domain-containing protein [Glutamicibacter]CBT75856.1 putative transcriptional regulator [Glutamicibacter arilaitensis Re117]HCH48050.1 WYL domain-containing protein [Glutamicibacter sp.]HCM94989.1 WYL domain-containing protein [Glutamicibacter sp.]
MSTKQTSGPSKAERLTSLIYALATTSRKFNAERIGSYLAPEGSKETREKALDRLKDDIRNDFGLQLNKEVIDGVTYYSIDTTDWFLPPVEFSPAEAGLVALAASLWKDTKLQSLGLNAAARVTGHEGDTSPVASLAGSLVPRLSLDEPNFRECALAVFNHNTLKFDYRSSNGAPSQRIVDVWGIGQRYGNWYFTGYDHTRQDTRVFRLSRVQGKFVNYRHGSGASDPSYRARPEDFDMTKVLQDFDLQNPGLVATVKLLGEEAIPLRAQAVNGRSDQDELQIGYADPHSFAQQLAGYGPAVKVLAPGELVNQVRQILGDARTAQLEQGTKDSYADTKFRPHRATGRGTTTTQVMRNIDMIQYVHAHGIVEVEELAQRYSMTVAKVREELAMIMMCGVPYGQHDELINVNDGDVESDTVTISNAALLAEPQKLAPLEAVAILGGLNALASIPEFEHQQVLNAALAKVNSAVARFDGWNGALGFALSKARENDIPQQLIQAIRAQEVVRIDYYSARSRTHQERDVEPIRLIEDGAVQYLRAWCRKRESLLTFRVDRMLCVENAGEQFALAVRHEDQQDVQIRYESSADDLEVMVHVDAEFLPVIEAFHPLSWSAGKVGAGYLANVRFSDHQVAAPLVARHSGKLTVVSPDATREHVVNWLDEAIRLYED